MTLAIKCNPLKRFTRKVSDLSEQTTHFLKCMRKDALTVTRKSLQKAPRHPHAENILLQWRYGGILIFVVVTQIFAIVRKY